MGKEKLYVYIVLFNHILLLYGLLLLYFPQQDPNFLNFYKWVDVKVSPPPLSELISFFNGYDRKYQISSIILLSFCKEERPLMQREH